MSSRKTYRLVLTWQHRKWGPQMAKLTAEGTTIRRAIANALLGFFSETTTKKDRRDAHVSLTLTATRMKKEAAR